MSQPQFKAGDEVFVRISQEAETEILLAGAVLDSDDPSGIHIRFAVANEEGKFEEDWVNAADLTLVAEHDETNASTAVETKVTFRDRAAIGLKYGIPVTPLRGKAPFLPAWQNAATANPEQIERWNAQFPDANCGMVAKLVPAGCWCLEVDSTEINEQYKTDTGKNLPNDTLMVKSAGGPGRGHRWFRHTPASLAMGNIGQKEAKGFSVRADNEQAVAPFSVHPDTGAIYTLLKDVPPVDAPDELIAWLLKQKKSFASKTVNPSASAMAEAPIPSGSRNNTLTSLGGKLHHSGVEDDLVLEALLRANEKRCIPPLPVDEVTMIAKSVCRYDTSSDAAATVSFGAKPAQPASATGTPATTSEINQATDGRRVIHLIRASSVKPRHVRWMWPNRILANKPNVLFGEPGRGKGFVGLDFIARATTGQDFPDCLNTNAPCEVIITCAEDSYEETIVPRLILAGADMDKVHFLAIQRGAAGSVEEGLLALDVDLPGIEGTLRNFPNVRIIFIDPLATYMGELDPNKDRECRPIYTKMATLAEKYNICFVLIAHPNKNEQASVINRLSGAKALTSVFRNTWLVEKHPDEKDTCLLLNAKKNLASSGSTQSLKFHIANIPETEIVGEDGEHLRNVGKLVWDGLTDHTADDVLQSAADGGKTRKQKKEDADTLSLLKEFLSNGARPATEFYEKAHELDLSDWAVRKAKDRARVRWDKFVGVTYWALNDEDLKIKKAEIFEKQQVLFPAKNSQKAA